MLRIGITGGIGSGKTIISKLFALQKISVFYADLQAKILMHSDVELIGQLKTTFGSDVYLPDGSLNRSKLASIVFNDESKLTMLNSMVHPAVFKAFDTWVDKQNSPYVLKEAALLFESGSDKDCDKTILVKAPLELKISRVIQRDSITREDVLKRINNQLSDDEKEKLSDYIVMNNEEELLIPQIIKLHNQFLKLAKG